MRSRYGDPDVLSLRTVATPVPEPGQVLVQVAAAALNPADLHRLRGRPYLMRPSLGWRRPRAVGFGSDLAGRVVAVGDGVSALAVGDRVAGSGQGACAEIVAVAAERLAQVPDGVSLADAAALPIAASTAYQALAAHARLEPGRHVLVNGASGGVGTFAVQRAAMLGLEVTAVCSTRNVELVASLGAAHVIDYSRSDWVVQGHYDAIIDTVGDRSPRACLPALAEGGSYVMVGAPISHPWIDPAPRLLAGRLAYAGRSAQFRWFVAHAGADSITTILDDVAAGRVRPVIGRRVALADVAEAMRELADGHVVGKTVVEIDLELQGRA
ncbi:MAG: NAD(P)-dependent alcohol dehydrogenase [Nocardioidaceae bacterium]|nr:NAD(P)-dependent alcohol dehydrogenase [Nocardioidaceae bacterium]